MGQEVITVMVCDRCGKRLEIRPARPGMREYPALSEAGKWESLYSDHMGGRDTWLVCPECFADFKTFLNYSKETTP